MVPSGQDSSSVVSVSITATADTTFVVSTQVGTGGSSGTAGALQTSPKEDEGVTEKSWFLGVIAAACFVCLVGVIVLAVIMYKRASSGPKFVGDEYTTNMEFVAAPESEHTNIHSALGGSLQLESLKSSVPSDRKLRAKYAYTAVNSDELTLKVGDIVSLLDEFDDGWARGSLPSGQSGVFPMSYTVPAPSKPASSSPMPSRSLPPPPAAASKTVVAKFAYTAAQPDELSFRPGDEITVEVEDGGDGWGRGTLVRTGDVGVYPVAYVGASGLRAPPKAPTTSNKPLPSTPSKKPLPKPLPKPKPMTAPKPAPKPRT